MSFGLSLPEWDNFGVYHSGPWAMLLLHEEIACGFLYARLHLFRVQAVTLQSLEDRQEVH